MMTPGKSTEYLVMEKMSDIRIYKIVLIFRHYGVWCKVVSINTNGLMGLMAVMSS